MAQEAAVAILHRQLSRVLQDLAELTALKQAYLHARPRPRSPSPENEAAWKWKDEWVNDRQDRNNKIKQLLSSQSQKSLSDTPRPPEPVPSESALSQEEVQLLEKDVEVLSVSSCGDADPALVMRNRLRVRKQPFVVHHLRAKLEEGY